MHIGHAGDVLDMVLPCKSIYNSTCRSPVSCSGEPTATCLCVYLAASGLNPIGGALLHLLPGRATGAAVTAVGDQPPPPGCRAGGPRATRSPPDTRVPRRRTPCPQSPGGSGERHTDAHPDRDKGPLVGSWNRREERSG